MLCKVKDDAIYICLYTVGTHVVLRLAPATCVAQNVTKVASRLHQQSEYLVLAAVSNGWHRNRHTDVGLHKSNKPYIAADQTVKAGVP